jgi:hypothetical protein
MSKVFRDFEKNTYMKIAGIVSIIGIVITIAIFGIIFTANPNSDVAEVENTLDKELIPNEETTPEIQEKIDEIKQIANENYYKPTSEINWTSSGPFQIDRTVYDIGQKIFIRIGGLQEHEKGQIAVMRPLNSTHHTTYITIPFDGMVKSAFNYYVEPGIIKTRGICSTDDLTGNWALVFRGTNYANMDFEITDKVVPSTNIETVC